MLSGASLACMRLRVLQELQPENWISNGSCYTVMLKPPGLDTVLNKVRGWAPPGREGGGDEAAVAGVQCCRGAVPRCAPLAWPLPLRSAQVTSAKGAPLGTPPP